MQTSQLSNKLRVSKDGLQERVIVEWVNVYEKKEPYRTEQRIGGIIMMLLFIIILLK